MAVESAEDLATFFDANEFALAATYTPSVGSPAAVTVLFDEVDETAELGLSGSASPGPVARVRTSEIAAPAEGATLSIGARNFTIKKAVADDQTRSIWRLALREV